MVKPQVIHINTQKPPNWVNTMMSSISQRISSTLFGVSKNGKRNLNEIYGYSETLDFNQLYWMWRRGGLAFRIVNGFARSCWRDGIRIMNDGEERFEDEIKILNKYGHMVKRLEQADVLNRIGRFSVLFVGVPDGLAFDKPLGSSNTKRLRDVYFRPYAEDGVSVITWVKDKFDPRYGLPEIYQLTVENRGDKNTEIFTQPIKVHHSRIVHLAEGSLDSDFEGISCLEAIFNTLQDMFKTTGGAAEAYFRNTRGRFSMETDPKFSAVFSDEDKVKLEEEAQAFTNQWKDFIRAGGVNIKPLNIPHNSPLDTVKVLLQILAGTTGYPIRILTGEGAGQLAGNEDKESYNQIVQDRRDLWCTGWAMRVFEILTDANMMKVSDTDEISWETPNVVSGKDKSIISSANATALSQVATAVSSPGMDGIISVEDAMELVFGKDEISGIEFQDTIDDGLTKEELAEADLGNLPTNDENEEDDEDDD